MTHRPLTAGVRSRVLSSRMLLWHRWCTPLLIALVSVWLASGWYGCAAQTKRTRVELSSGRVLVLRGSKTLDPDDTGVYLLGPVVDRSSIELLMLNLDPTAPLEPSSQRVRFERWQWNVLIVPFTTRVWDVVIWPLGAVLVMWNMCVVSYRLGARRGHRCLRCGYDLRGLATQATCPECGKC